MKKNKTILKVLLFTLTLISLISCSNTQEIQSEAINKNISIDAKIAAIDAYGNITLNILAQNIIDADFDYNKKLILQFSNGYLIESNLTISSNNIQDGKCYIRTINEDNPITIGIKSKNLAQIGTLEIGDYVKIYQLELN